MLFLTFYILHLFLSLTINWSTVPSYITSSLTLMYVFFAYLSQVMFENYQFDGLYIAIQAVLTLYAQGKWINIIKSIHLLDCSLSLMESWRCKRHLNTHTSWLMLATSPPSSSLTLSVKRSQFYPTLIPPLLPREYITSIHGTVARCYHSSSSIFNLLNDDILVTDFHEVVQTLRSSESCNIPRDDISLCKSVVL